jgi:glycine/D-amino acid oxidase-like deaminating enzyme
LKTADSVGFDSCYYSMTPDEGFVIDFAPGTERVVVMAGFSGHGFKFAPLLGRAAAELVCDGVTEIGEESTLLQRFTD